MNFFLIIQGAVFKSHLHQAAWEAAEVEPQYFTHFDSNQVLFWDVHPGKLTWNIIMEVWKIIFLSKWVIYMFHVNLPGSIPLPGSHFSMKELSLLLLMHPNKSYKVGPYQLKVEF